MTQVWKDASRIQKGLVGITLIFWGGDVQEEVMCPLFQTPWITRSLDISLVLQVHKS